MNKNENWQTVAVGQININLEFGFVHHTFAFNNHATQTAHESPLHTLKSSRPKLIDFIDEFTWRDKSLMFLYLIAGFQRQTTPNGSHNGNGNSMRDPISPVHNDSSDYKYGEENF